MKGPPANERGKFAINSQNLISIKQWLQLLE